ncbi:anhydro-N-acetylmuramic acid kinase, partial [Candidatus Bathyarchaeota archaeon]|nr:anhydro-N-acetylmuramic acid kinase [Candidatus Bathyarchaeota archaeon]
AHPTLARSAHNLGGISNLTYLPAGAGLDELLAFDTGPGNMIIDAAVKHFTGGAQDEDGVIAESGTVHEGLLEELLRHPFYGRSPPKSTGREMFGEQYTAGVIALAEKLGLCTEDVVATVSALTVESIASSYETHLRGSVDEVYLSGGGARNPYIVGSLRRRLNLPLHDYSRLGYPSEAKEALLMALLANEHVMGTPCNIPAATGARSRAVLGVVSLP